MLIMFSKLLNEILEFCVFKLCDLIYDAFPLVKKKRQNHQMDDGSFG